MNIYLISQKVNCGYDTYDSAVVAAPDEDTARHIHPYGFIIDDSKYIEDGFNSWCRSKDVSVKYIGKAVMGIEQGVICASFNAG